MEVFKTILNIKRKKVPEIIQKPFHFLRTWAIVATIIIVFDRSVCDSQKIPHQNDEHYDKNNSVSPIPCYRSERP